MGHFNKCCCECSPVTIDRWLNISTMKDESDADVAPFERLTEYSDVCGLFANTCLPSSGGVHCLSVISDETVRTNLPADNGTTVLAQNTFEQSGTVERLTCQYGFQNIQAWKTWHGVYPLTYDGDGKLCSGEGAKSNTKYTALNSSVSYSYKSGQRMWHGATLVVELVANESNYSGNLSMAVDKDSGVRTGSGDVTLEQILRSISFSGDCVSGFTGDATVTSDNSYTLCAGDAPDTGSGANLSLFAADLATEPRCTNDTYSMGKSDPLVGGTGYYSPPYEMIQEIVAIHEDATGNPFPTPTVGGWDTSGSYDFTVYDGVAGNYRLEWNFQVIRIGNQYYVNLELDWQSFSPVTGTNCTEEDYKTSDFRHEVYTLTFTLSSAYTVADVYAKTTAAVGNFLFGDESKYPYRTDVYPWVAPLFVYSEPQTPMSPCEFHCDPYTDPNAALYDGTLQQALLPAGYGEGSPRGVFDFFVANYEKDFCSATSAWQTSWMGNGAYTPSYLPANTAHWTRPERFSHYALTGTAVPSYIYPCNFVHVSSDGVYLQKMAETLIPVPAYDFARPYGADRFKLDEQPGYVFCVDSVSGSDVTLLELNGDTPSSLPFGSGDVLGPVTIGGVRGFYAFSSASGNVVTVGSKVLDVPTGWNTPSGDGATAFGKLVYPNAPGFGGRLACTATYDSGSGLTTFAVAASIYIQTGDKVDAMSNTFTALGTNLTITRVSDTSFTVTGDYSTAAWLVPNKLFDGTTTGQKYYFASTARRGSYVWREWLVDWETETELSYTATQKNRIAATTRPAVVGASPNTETLTDAEFEPFPASINNGEVWLGEIEQWMVDPLWQYAHRPCGLDPMTSWTIGSDYPYPDFFEARIEVPCDYGALGTECAPTPPAPIDLGAAIGKPQYEITPNVSGDIMGILQSAANMGDPTTCAWFWNTV